MTIKAVVLLLIVPWAINGNTALVYWSFKINSINCTSYQDLKNNFIFCPNWVERLPGRQIYNGSSQTSKSCIPQKRGGGKCSKLESLKSRSPCAVFIKASHLEPRFCVFTPVVYYSFIVYSLLSLKILWHQWPWFSICSNNFFFLCTF